MVPGLGPATGAESIRTGCEDIREGNYPVRAPATCCKGTLQSKCKVVSSDYMPLVQL